jgi:meso-butanediol dehydrogenase/(S,S)-butanediol dehydrogenase/diacetyl reductase
VQGDVTDESDIVDSIAKCRNAFGRIDAMHNSAGIDLVGLPHEVSNGDWNRTVAINLTAVLWVAGMPLWRC